MPSATAVLEQAKPYFHRVSPDSREGRRGNGGTLFLIPWTCPNCDAQATLFFVDSNELITDDNLYGPLIYATLCKLVKDQPYEFGEIITREFTDLLSADDHYEDIVEEDAPQIVQTCPGCKTPINHFDLFEIATEFLNDYEHGDDNTPPFVSRRLVARRSPQRR